MFRKMVFASLFLLPCVSVAAAQSSPGAKAQDDTTKLIEQRVRFVRDAYGLDPKQAQRLRSELMSLKSEHESYVSRFERTLRREAKAIADVIPQQDNYDDAMKAKLTERMQNDIYKIHAKAPLSLANVVKKAEGMLSRAQINQGRRKIAAQFAAALKGAPLDVAKIDRLVIKPIVPNKHPTQPAFLASSDQPNKQGSVSPKKGEAKPTPPKRVVAKPIQIKPQRRPQAKPPLNRPPRATPPNRPPTPVRRPAQRKPASPKKPLPPAPPTEQWTADFQKTVAHYGFSNKQKKVGQTVLKSCLTRAQAYLQKEKGAIEAAKKSLAGNEKAKRLAELKRPLDKLYSELNRRLRSVATIEQIQAAKKKQQEKAGKK